MNPFKIPIYFFGFMYYTSVIGLFGAAAVSKAFERNVIKCK